MALSCFSCLCCIVILGVVGIVAFYYMADDGTVKGIHDLLPEDLQQELFKKEDPFSGLNETKVWRNNQNGLPITIINALDKSWYTYFNIAVLQWDAGIPDALTINTKISRLSNDTECEPVTNHIKVCNDNYGETNWKGVNQVYSDENGFIISSVALMNEYYLSSEDLFNDDKQYTMCHEIGHGFGLPHSDEIFMNRDRLNCMDYTVRPSRNKQPSTENYEYLQKLYGSVENNSTETSTQDVTESMLAAKPQSSDEQRSGHKGQHYLRKKPFDSAANSSDEKGHRALESTPSWLIHASQEVHFFLLNKGKMTDYRQHDRRHLQQQQILHKNDFGEAHSFRLENGYGVELHLLY
jgi:predicted Zn-dependent protease